MRALIQRVNYAEVKVAGESVGKIGPGILALIGMQKEDDEGIADKLLDRILAYRIFSDAEGKMNLSLSDTSGGLLLVSQFTLAAATDRGLRPSFSSAMPPQPAEKLYNYLLEQARLKHAEVASGQFAADMQVALENNGPVTFLLEV
jgi:D-tyrosyl-tRNA(Tyr) deacylase